MLRLNIYKPNAKVDGCACSWSCTDQGIIYLNMIKQASWNEKTKKGSFSENRESEDKKTNLKFNEFEAGSLIAAIENFSEVSFFHQFGDGSDRNVQQITFKPWVKNQKIIDEAQKSGQPEPAPVKAFGLSVTRNSTDKFKMPLELGECYAIKRLLELAIESKLVENGIKKENPDSQ